MVRTALAVRKLTDEDVLHYRRIVAALSETIRIMGEIDAAIESHGGWPLPGSVTEGDGDESSKPVRAKGDAERG